MFTGIVEELGEVVAVDRGGRSAVIRIRGPLVVADTVPGASIAVNGVCLTVVEHTDTDFTVDVMAETLHRSSLGSATPGSPVNLERAMPATGRFGGHIVQGHVDATALILSREPGDRWEVVSIELPTQLARYVVEKGSITVDGVSLTVSAVSAVSAIVPGTPGSADLRDASSFSVSLIPTTLALTTLGRKGPGEAVNLEVDILAKYVERMLATSAEAPR